MLSKPVETTGRANEHTERNMSSPITFLNIILFLLKIASWAGFVVDFSLAILAT